MHKKGILVSAALVILLSFGDAFAGNLTYNRGGVKRTCSALLSLAGLIREVPRLMDKYATVPMRRKYYFLDWWNGTRYITIESVKYAEIDFEADLNGWVYAHSREPIPDGYYIFAMNGAGKIYIHPEVPRAEIGYRNLVHHSSFEEGKQLAAAGETSFRAGKFFSPNTATGHYSDRGNVDKRNRLMGYQLLSEIVSREADASVKLYLYGGDLVLIAEEGQIESRF